ncbi:TPA: hypothetical protein N0F65_001590 [Lagenidium giganteum]|uniref:Uncharacterized protein n=1 Tax=Lagenidium giganteum TaxID=4803 RepID=A0AAV2Z4X7_9STRA|nr:TPA: hypothetical protein N0F65_001590 [Lagenidium giganteum]
MAASAKSSIDSIASLDASGAIDVRGAIVAAEAQARSESAALLPALAQSAAAPPAPVDVAGPLLSLHCGIAPGKRTSPLKCRQRRRMSVLAEAPEECECAGEPMAPPSCPTIVPTITDLAADDTAGMSPEDKVRRLSMSSSTAGSVFGHALEDDIRSMSEQMQRVLAFCELQSQNPLRLQSKINDLQEQLQMAIAEKNYWMKRCKEEMARENRSCSEDLQCVKSHPRRRSNSELKFIADNFGSPGDGFYHDDIATASGDGDSDSGSSSSSDSVGLARSSFRLLQCSDEQCEVFTPMNRSIRTQHRSRNNVHFLWDERPKTVLIVKKPNEPMVTQMLLRQAKWLMEERKLNVYLEPTVHAELQIPNTSTWTSEEHWEECQLNIDFVISLGGDGTVLWVSSLFRKSVPPVISFAMGSLGFLTPFETRNDTEHLDSVINGGFYMSLRSRLVGTIVRRGDEHEPLAPVHALNEIVIDRGPSAALVELVCYCDGLEITKIAADGIIIGTPTGSTAYSLSAGGSMTHPSVPTMLFTPICPHTLSFRPLLFHDSATLKIEFPETSRATSAYVSFDGKNRVQLQRGDSITVRVSSYPLPAICKINENQDWFESMTTNLNWNQRRTQKPWSIEPNL